MPLGRSVEALRAAAAAAAPAEAARWNGEAERLVRRRAGLSQRWDAAFATLHAELETLRRLLAAWVCVQRESPTPTPAAPNAAAAPMSCA